MDLRQRIGRHVLVSLLLIWGLGSTVVMAVGNHFVVEAFDRALLDDAHGLAAHVRGGTGGAPLELALSPREVGILLLDQSATSSFAVIGPDGAVVAGEPALTADRVQSGKAQVFSTLVRDGSDWRKVTLRLEGPPEFTIVMAQATESRTQLLRHLLVYSGLAQVWLLVVLGSRLLRGIEKDLRPLAELQDAVERRDAADLQPLPPALTQQASTRDVQRLGQALDGLLARLREGLLAQREFAGNVAHELRTPLAGIRAQAAHALADDDPAVWRRELEGIALAEQRASRTVDQLLALARAAEGDIALALQSLPLEVLVRDVVLRFLPRADALGVDLGAEGLEHRVKVRGNVGLLEGILSNLLDNALRYGRGDPPRITVVLQCEQAHAVVRVVDNGPGVDAALAHHVQQRWAQGGAGLSLGQGAGLGLSIVARYAELMGGRLELQPLAPGLAAIVWLPLDASPEPAGAPANAVPG
jgi:two-component system sensor histidine kinase TctE